MHEAGWAGVERTRQLQPWVYAWTGAGKKLHLTLYWLVHTRVKSEVAADGSFGGTFKVLDSHTGHREIHRLRDPYLGCMHLTGTPQLLMPVQLTPCSDAHGGHDGQLF